MAALFPARTLAEQLAIVAESALVRIASAALSRVVRRIGATRVASRVRVIGAEALHAARAEGRAVVLVAWHAGLVSALGASLAALGIEALVLRHRGGGDDDDVMMTVTTEGAPALALHKAVRHARSGGVVAVVLDVSSGWAARKPGPFALLGRAVKIPRGAAAIARLGRAELMCIAPRLGARGLEVVVSPPLARADSDKEQMRHVVAWWQAWLEAHPGDLWPESARAIAAYPVDASPRLASSESRKTE